MGVERFSVTIEPDGKSTLASDGTEPTAADQLASAPVDARDSAQTAPNLNWPAGPVVVDINDLDWSKVEKTLTESNPLSRIAQIVANFQQLLEQKAGRGMLFDPYRSDPKDHAIQLTRLDDHAPLWFIGDLHGDLLALEAALLLIREHSLHGSSEARIVFLGDLFDDEGYGLATVLRAFELASQSPDRICIIAGNHDEALRHDGVRFHSVVEPSDFSGLLNANLGNADIVTLGKMVAAYFASAPRALFLPDGLLVAHGGFPLADLHAQLWETGNWNDERCLTDFVWSRAHPTARKKLPNRHSKGSQFGYEDFATFCSLAESLGRRVTHMIRGHDHVEQRFAVYPAYTPHPILTINTLSRRLPREFSGAFERTPAVALYRKDALPQVFRLQVPAAMIGTFYAQQPAAGGESGGILS
jgi:hypothetical protein